MSGLELLNVSWGRVVLMSWPNKTVGNISAASVQLLIPALPLGDCSFHGFFNHSHEMLCFRVGKRPQGCYFPVFEAFTQSKFTESINVEGLSVVGFDDVWYADLP